MEHLMNMNKVPPTWLDQSYFEKVIRQLEKDPQATVLDFKLTPGSKAGDNMLSSVFRGAITFTSKFTKEPKTISTFIKVQLQFPPELAHFQNPVYFRNEMEMFGKVLPEVQALWSAAGDKEILAPKLIYQSNEPSPVIIIEDVSVEGFALITTAPDDFEESQKIFRRLAKFHAANFFLADEKKLDFTDFNFAFLKDPMTQGMFGQIISGFIEAAKEWEEFEQYIPKLESARSQFISKGLKTYTPNRGEFSFNVLNHSDLHRKNMLFKKTSDGAIDDFYIIDYQLCTYATPAIDLIYALFFFVSSENRKNRRGEIIATYYQQFVASLKSYGYLKAPPSLIDLQVELLRNGSLEFVIAVASSIFFYVDLGKLAESGVDITSLQSGEGFKVLFQTPGFKEIIFQELPRWCHNGFI